MGKENQHASQLSVRLLRLPDVEQLTGLRKSSIYAYMGKERGCGFPVPVRIGARAVAWRESDVLGWISSRAEIKPRGNL